PGRLGPLGADADLRRRAPTEMTLNPLEPFARFLRPHRTRVVLGLVLLAGAQLVGTAIPLVLQAAVDTARALAEEAAPAPQWGLGPPAAAIIALSLLVMLLQMGMRWCLNSTSRLVENDIRRAYFAHLLTLSLSFYQRHRIGDLMARATNDVQAVRMWLGFGMRMLAEAVLAVAFSLAVMCSIDWRLTLWALLPMPLLSLTMRSVAGQVHRGFRQVQESFATISARVQENLSGIRVVKSYVQREPEVARFAELNRDYVARNRHLIRIQSLFFPLTFLLGGISLGVILWAGGRQVVAGTLSLGQFVALNAYLTRLIFPMINLGWMVDRYQRGLASMRRLEEIFAVAPQITDPETPAQGPTRGEIEFRQVSFAYDGQEVLHGIDLRVPAGSTLAVVGRVGAGKTTLARLVPRLIQATTGQVLIDGVPVGDIRLEELRGSIGYVPQETFLFSDSVRANVAFGDPEAQEPRLQEAVRAAQLEGDLSALLAGLDTVVGERGVTLSGGQKQRAALARAILRRPLILILDDALASVDTYTEEGILAGLRKLLAGRTTILIAHRISTVRQAHRIVVLAEGRIAEQGTHAELLAHNGIYADMHRRQSLRAQLGEG
ncbi:MAG: ABC transporter ATP-binding protein, partial [Candidatus Latescibacterota bacterium]